MKRALRLTLAAGAAAAVAMWTLAAVAVWWLLQAAAGALEGGSPAAAMQAVTAWTERPWVQHWLDRHEAEALLDGVDWLLGLGGGPVVWLGTVLAFLGAALVIAWGGGIVLAVLAGWAVIALLRRLGNWWRDRAAWPWAPRTPPAAPAASVIATSGG